MVPNWGVFTKRFGVPRFTLFNALKASARNWKLALSVRRNARASAKSKVCIGGPVTEFRPALPKVNAGGAANAAGLNHFAAVCVPGPNSGWPVTLARIGFSPSTVPEFAVSPNTEMVKGIPRSEEHTSELQSHVNLVCRLLL